MVLSWRRLSVSAEISCPHFCHNIACRPRSEVSDTTDRERCVAGITRRSRSSGMAGVAGVTLATFAAPDMPM